jgi:hypothetical protein
MEENKKTSGLQFFWRITACHTVTYFIMGILASTLFNYKNLFGVTMLASFMRPIDSPWVAAGPALQVFRGLLFALILWPIKNIFLEGKKGWFILWSLFTGLAIFGTAGPSPGSLEGIIYTKIPIGQQLIGLPEVVLQTLLFSVAVVSWYKKPSRIWNVVMAIVVILIILMSGAGIFLR